MAGVFSGHEQKPDPTICFVMMPFSDNFNAVYRVIQRCCSEQRLTCVRADEDVLPGKITGKIYDLISSAGVIISDMTGRNANVFYELGLAHAISDNVVLLTQSTEDVPFDLKDFFHIRYANTFEGAERLSTELSKVLSVILSSASLRIPLDDERRRIQVVQPSQLPILELDLGLAHLQAEIASSGNDMQQAYGWLQKALEVAKSGGGDAPEIGNCAIEAESCKFYDLAESLYESAVARNPMHVNNRQSYVSFLLDHRANDPTKMELAGSILSDLEGTAERQERTRGLKAQYLTMRQKRSGQPDNLDAIIAEAVGDGDFRTLQQAAPVLRVLQDTGKYDDMRTLINGLRGKPAGDENRVLDRVLADAYASSGNDMLHTEAIAIYERLLLDEPNDDMTDEKHNLATLLFARDRRDTDRRACQLWTEAYSKCPTNTSIQKGFARYLVHHDRKQDAAKVLAGRPIG